MELGIDMTLTPRLGKCGRDVSQSSAGRMRDERPG